MADKKALKTKIDLDVLTKQFHKTYSTWIDRWSFWQVAYDGGDDFIDTVLDRHPRESLDNYNQRKKEAYNFNYTREIVDLFNFYLTEKPAIRELGSLPGDKAWNAFYTDCDLYGTNYDVFINEAEKLASIYGAVGILVDKLSVEYQTREQEIENNVYPYFAVYTLPNILDWAVEREKGTGRPVLTYLKLLNYDGTYTLWWQDQWQHWEIVKDDNGEEIDARKTGQGDNPLGEIPFIWMLNIRSSRDPYFGISDIVEISKMCASITRNLSYGEEIIKFAAFPMLLEPMSSEEEEGKYSVVGVRAVKEFDPEHPEAKPEWLESEVLEPISAILDWIDRKIAAIYDNTHISGIHQTAKSREARSGITLRYEFQLLASVLSKKNDLINEAELALLYLWLKWQNDEEEFDRIRIKRTKEFSIDDLSQNLENILQSMKTVVSEHYYRLSQKEIAKRTLPDISDSDKNQIMKEIDASERPDMNVFTGGEIEEEAAGGLEVDSGLSPGQNERFRR